MAATKDTTSLDQIRETIGNVYTFVRSREINKTIASFTFDHYIAERQTDINGSMTIQSSSVPGTSIDVRPGELDALAKLEQDFNACFAKAKQIATAQP